MLAEESNTNKSAERINIFLLKVMKSVSSLHFLINTSESYKKMFVF